MTVFYENGWMNSEHITCSEVEIQEGGLIFQITLNFEFYCIFLESPKFPQIWPPSLGKGMGYYTKGLVPSLDTYGWTQCAKPTNENR